MLERKSVGSANDPDRPGLSGVFFGMHMKDLAECCVVDFLAASISPVFSQDEEKIQKLFQDAIQAMGEMPSQGSPTSFPRATTSASTAKGTLRGW